MQQIARSIRENNVILSQLGVSLPIISSMKAIIDRSNENNIVAVSKREHQDQEHQCSYRYGYHELPFSNQTSGDKSKTSTTEREPVV